MATWQGGVGNIVRKKNLDGSYMDSCFIEGKARNQ